MLRISVILAGALLLDFLVCLLVGSFLQFSSEPAAPAESKAASFSGFRTVLRPFRPVPRPLNLAEHASLARVLRPIIVALERISTELRPFFP